MAKSPDSTTPLSPAVMDAGLAGEQAGIRVCGPSGALDSQRMRRKAQLVEIACDIASVAKRYQKIHHILFGFSVRKVLRALQSDKLTDFPSLEIELESIEAESKCIQQAISKATLDGPPRHVKMAIVIRDALEEYAKAVSDVALNLNLICRSLRRESRCETGFADYSAGRFRHDKAVYDASVQEFRRWGARLTALFKTF